jgi:putative endonuclease
MAYYYVYIMSNKSRTLYTGVTNSLEHRVAQHKARTVSGFTAKYNVTQLVYFDEFTNVNDAIAAEKKIKGWTRAKKIALVESKNPLWDDLAAR